MNPKLDFRILNNGSFQNKAFVMLHGWKGNKNSFVSISKMLDIPNCRWYFPEAPFEVDGNPMKKTWTYEKEPDVWETEIPKAMLTDFFEREVFDSFDPKDTYVMGFSQGAAVCYSFILALNYTLGGIFPVGGFIRNYPEQSHEDAASLLEVSDKQKDTPILIGHGKDDDIVSSKGSIMAYDTLKNRCSNVKLNIYNGRHKIGLGYLREVRNMILKKDSLKVYG